MGEQHNEEKDTELWYAELIKGSGSSENTDLKTLRHVIRMSEQQDISEHQKLTHDWERIRFALRRETEKVPASSTLVWLRYGAQAALLLLAVFSINWLLPNDESQAPELPAMRGRSIHELFVDDVQHTSEQIVKRLQEQGIRARKKELQAGMVEIDADLTDPLTTSVRSYLQTLEILPPYEHQVRIIVMQRAKSD